MRTTLVISGNKITPSEKPYIPLIFFNQLQMSNFFQWITYIDYIDTTYLSSIHVVCDSFNLFN